MRRLFVVLTLLGLCMATGSAQAAFPGTNGRIVFSTTEGVIFSILPDGSGERRLTSEGSDPDVSADGRRIVYSDHAADVHLMRHDGDGDRRVLRDGIQPGFSPEGDEIVFNREQDIWKATIRGDRQRRLTNPQECEEDSLGGFSPTGGGIAFSRWAPPPVVEWVPSCAPDETLFEEPTVVLIDATGGGRRIVTTGMDPDFGPRGRRLVFAGEDGIFVARRDGSKVRRLTRSEGFFVDREPVFSPNGKRIAFSRRGPDERDVWVMRANGSREGPLTEIGDGVNSANVDWGPRPRRR